MRLFFLLLILPFGLGALELESPAFNKGEYIPSRFSYGSLNHSPPLVWRDVPSGTRSFLIICEDPDAPRGTWLHWLIFNIPPDKRSLEENIPPQPVLPDGSIQIRNDFGKFGYGGPYPPPGKPHRYFFRIFALDTRLNLSPRVTKKEVMRAIKGHILGRAEIYGLYQR